MKRFVYMTCRRCFGPDTFCTLQRCIKEELRHPSLKLVLSLLRLSGVSSTSVTSPYLPLILTCFLGHDADIFYKFKQTIIERVAEPETSERLQRDLRKDIRKAILLV